MADPMDALFTPITPIAPRAAFAADLRRRLDAALRPEPPGGPMSLSYVPQRLHTITPYLIVHDARASIDWYQDVFGATIETEPIVMDDDRVGHVELRIGDAVFMMADEFPEMGIRGPRSLGGTSVSFVLYVEDVDVTFAYAVEHGAAVDRPVADQFHGSRAGWLVDPFGHRWNISTSL